MNNPINEFTPGQCWFSEAEPELGLGAVVQLDGRRLTVHYHAADATRVYASDTAPLRRLVCKPGEAVVSKDGFGFVIARVQLRNGLYYYTGRSEGGQELIIPETELLEIPPRNAAEEALLGGQFDRLSRYQLRAETLLRREHVLSSPLRGLGNNRTALLPHQLYLADEIGSRHAPRVLLADEVGLGKTIEAGMIIQRQLQSGRISRVLLLLPENLQHQWLVEMLRRFSLRFSLFDRERFEDSDWENPLLSEQLVITSLELLTAEPEYALHACDGEWGMLVVDEAHRLGGMEPEPSPGFSLVAALAGETPAVLLVTATPEQLGQSAHFDRLRLLDAGRFHDFAQFQQQANSFQQIAQLYERLSESAWSAELCEQLRQNHLLDGAELPGKESQLDPIDDVLRQTVLNRLLDRHGTGRLLFRNTRAAVGGFPLRTVHHYPLSLPAAYLPADLCPEAALTATEWWRNDPRVEWLLAFVTGEHDGKVLLICSDDTTARQLHDYLRLQTTLRSALFHAEMTLVQRDRAAAWFAEPTGAQLMICSEVGSEGRNFQAARHLVLFDLPLNPELLEQRIGRIDRIGQGDSIELHLPLFDRGAQAVLWEWCQQALDIFATPSPAALTVFQKFELRLLAVLAGGEDAELIAEAEAFRRLEEKIIETGRDRLLELNSCRMEQALELQAQLQARDSENSLEEFIDTLLPELGVEVEPHSARTLVLHPGPMMSGGALPELPDDGVTVTFDRLIALQREEMVFLTDEHPLALGAMEKWIESGQGLAAAAVVRDTGLKPGTLLLETLHVTQITGGAELGMDRYLPPTLIRQVAGAADFNNESTRVEPDLARVVPFLRTKESALKELLTACFVAAEEQLENLCDAANQRIEDELGEESARLRALQAVNPAVRDDEIAAIGEQQLQLIQRLQLVTMRLEGCCVLIVQN
ncbi:MAG: RNA polymerase-associated protein RapA [Gammaproteobacteria bacterium]|nr:MAG: RNA polymerase-associated protein RapA [Gammaproteobacteria bacterium]